MEKIIVDLDERSYPVYIGFDILRDAGNFIDSNLVCIITNPVVANLYSEPLISGIERAGRKTHEILIPEGERSKDISHVMDVYDSLIGARAQRSTPLLALGGGVVGDVGGFVAATYMRGIPYIQVPTTLLSQVDSSVGGKTGVNHPRGKNLIGVFYQPKFVLIDINTLSSLPKKEFLSGISEVIKYGVISRSHLFDYLEDNREKIIAKDADSLQHIVRESIKIKADIVSRDERESGLRSILNFGHTLGHAIERLSGYGSLRHGEAVAKGISAATLISKKIGMISEDEGKRIMNLLESYGFDLALPSFSRKQYVDAINNDKKAQDSQINFVLTEGIGYVSLKKMTATDIVEIIEF